MKRGRFAPTPSGPIHIGNAWTALLCWLQVRSAQGQFVLRIEDIDQARSRKAFADLILKDLSWLGLDWDEGPDVGGPYGPYVQSARISRYEEAFKRLLNQSRLYPCYCSRAELLKIASAPHGLASEGPSYPGTCSSLTAEQRAQKAAVKAPSFRFRLPQTELHFTDLLAGRQSYAPGTGGDFVVKRADGVIAYQLAVVLDDADMHITDVWRGGDLLDSTPRQLLLYEALGLKAPQFAHVPLICNDDGSRLSKRNASLNIRSLREAGVRPQKIIGLFAYLAGMNDRLEPMQARELIAHFECSALPREPVILKHGLFIKALQPG